MKFRLASLLGGLFFFIAIGCPHQGPPQPCVPCPQVDAGIASDEADAEESKRITCADVCKHGWDLSCEWSKSTPKGATCLDVCNNVMTSGLVKWNLGCMLHSSSCQAADRCH